MSSDIVWICHECAEGREVLTIGRTVRVQETCPVCAKERICTNAMRAAQVARIKAATR